jgi:hypothetical protein
MHFFQTLYCLHVHFLRASLALFNCFQNSKEYFKPWLGASMKTIKKLQEMRKILTSFDYWFVFNDGHVYLAIKLQ